MIVALHWVQGVVSSNPTANGNKINNVGQSSNWHFCFEVIWGNDRGNNFWALGSHVG